MCNDLAYHVMLCFIFLLLGEGERRSANGGMEDLDANICSHVCNMYMKGGGF